jgi:hypothetical protein
MSDNEKRVIASSYLTDFYVNVQTLTQQFCIFLNLIIEENQKKKEGVSLEEGEIETHKAVLQNLRYYINKTYISYKTIYPNLKLSLDPKIEATYREINKNYDIDNQKLEDFVIALNASLVNDVIKEILVNNSDIISQLYSNGQTTN